MGRRTRGITYETGVSGKQTCHLRCVSSSQNSVLLLTDSNGRNIVSPQVVSCRSELFTFNAISIPGGMMSHGCDELEFGRKVDNISIVILALGTNDINRGSCSFNHNIEKKCRKLVEVCQRKYPQCQVCCTNWLKQLKLVGSGCVTPEMLASALLLYNTAPMTSHVNQILAQCGRREVSVQTQKISARSGMVDKYAYVNPKISDTSRN